METKTIEKRKCLHCGSILKKRKGKKRLNPTRKFCDRKCQTRYAATKRYNRLKDDPEYKKYQKEKFYNWRIKNREHFNDLCREPSRLYGIKVRVIWKKEGLCINCGGERKEGYKQCEKCQKTRRDAYWRNKNRN